MFQKPGNFIRSHRILLVCAIVYLLPFFVFSFWNHLAADDYFIGVKKQSEGFWDIQYFNYMNWNGRYAAIFSTAVLVFTNLLYDTSDFIGIYFLTATLLSFFYLLIQINRYLLFGAISRLTMFTAALVLLIAELNVIPQPVTQFYWFSGAVTYQQPLILFFLLAGTATRVFFSSTYKYLYIPLALFLLVCMLGYNEMLTIWFLLWSTALAVFNIYTNQKNKRLIMVLMGCSYMAALILLLAPGNFSRANIFDRSPVVFIAGISTAKFIISTWFFLKEPLWWFFLFILISNTGLKHQLAAHAFFRHLTALRFIPLMVLYVALGILTYFPILYVSNGSIPYRMENTICFLNSLVLIMILFLKSPLPTHSGVVSLAYQYRFLLISMGIFLTTNMGKVFQTLASGFFYDQVMQERLAMLRTGSLKKQSVILLDNYNLAVQKKIQERFPEGTRKILQEAMVEKPPLLFFTDDLKSSDNILLLQKYFRVDSIIINTY